MLGSSFLSDLLTRLGFHRIPSIQAHYSIKLVLFSYKVQVLHQLHEADFAQRMKSIVYAVFSDVSTFY